MKRLLAAAFLLGLFATGCQCSNKPDIGPVEGQTALSSAPAPDLA